jgi:hypothetical protein
MFLRVQGRRSQSARATRRHRLARPGWAEAFGYVLMLAMCVAIGWALATVG